MPDVSVASVKSDFQVYDDASFVVLREKADAVLKGYSPEMFKKTDENNTSWRLTNSDTGWPLIIGREDRKKIAKNPKRGIPILQLVASRFFAEVVANAVLVESHKDLIHQHIDVVAVHRLYAPMFLDGKLYRVKLTVKEMGQRGGNLPNRLHSIDGVEIENAPLGNPLFGLTNQADTAQPTTRHTLSIAQLLHGAKRDSDGQPFEEDTA